MLLGAMYASGRAGGCCCLQAVPAAPAADAEGGLPSLGSSAITGGCSLVRVLSSVTAATSSRTKRYLGRILRCILGQYRVWLIAGNTFLCRPGLLLVAVLVAGEPIRSLLVCWSPSLGQEPLVICWNNCMSMNMTTRKKVLHICDVGQACLCCVILLLTWVCSGTVALPLLLLGSVLTSAPSSCPTCSSLSRRGASPYFPRGVGLTLLRELTGLGAAGCRARREGCPVQPRSKPFTMLICGGAHLHYIGYGTLW